MRKFYIKCFILLVCFATLVNAQNKPNKSPQNAQFVTSDIANFWRAYDLAKRETSFEKRVAIYQREYIDKGSLGLKGFMRGRIVNAKKLVQTIEKHPKFYKSIRKESFKTRKFRKRIIRSFKKLKNLYPEAVFPNVYFVIGRLNSGGTISDKGILIGTEMYCLTKQTPKGELNNWLKSVLAPIKNLPHIIAHESIHYQQQFRATTLLEKSIQEGGADFVAELISGKHINAVQHNYGNKNEKALWLKFQKEMYGKDLSNWMYDGNNAKNRPADMGYYMGYKICEAYYKQANDKKQAIKDMFFVKDAKDFLKKSGYAKKFLTD